MDNTIDRLRLQCEAFQNSFIVLTRSKNLEELAKIFFQILNSNLLVQDAVFFFRNREKTDWQILFPKQKINPDYKSLLKEDQNSKIAQIDHPLFRISINFPLTDGSIFRIFLGEKLDKSEYSEFDIIIIQFYLQQLTSAYQFYVTHLKEKELIFNLNHRVLQLNSLIDTGIEVSRLQESEQLLHLALERVTALTNASKGMLRIREGSRVVEKIFFPFPFKSKKLEQGKSRISASFRFSGNIYQFYLFQKESREGLVNFDATDQLLLDAFTRQVHVSLENNYLYEQSLEKERIDHEISIAGTIQEKLIPKELPKIERYDQYGINIPTKFIGGDFYDCIPLADGRFVLIMADVSGKGIAASLLVSTLHASVHAYLNGPFELESLVKKLNEVIYDAATIDKYITAVFALLDPQKNEILMVNAGHNPTYILRGNKSLESMDTGGIPLGMIRVPPPYGSSKWVLKPGDSVFFYTDGVTEAMNEKEEQYDDLRPITKFLKKSKAKTAKNFIEDLIADVNDFTSSTPQSDDITALYLMRTDP